MGVKIKEKKLPQRKFTCLEMEIAISKLFPIRKHIIVPNVSWGLLNHEADLIIMRPTGVLIEIEIKVSVADFKRDFEKRHGHRDSSNRISEFYYAIPLNLLDKCLSLIPEEAGIIVVQEFEYGKNEKSIYAKIEKSASKIKNSRKLTDKEQFQLARLGCLRIFNLKNKLLSFKKQL